MKPINLEKPDWQPCLRANSAVVPSLAVLFNLALACLETALDLVDHINPALAADQTVVAMATTQRFQRVTDLHETTLML